MAKHDHNNFDFLRLFAASLVVFSHSYPLSGLNYEPIAAFTGHDTGGGYAVGIFFIISGFLITGSYFTDSSGKAYFAKRILRIYPAFVISILLCMFVVGPIFTELPLSHYFEHSDTWRFLKSLRLYLIVYNLPGVFNNLPHHAVNGVYWTLPLEFTMYIVLFLAGWAGLFKKSGASWILALLFYVWHAYYKYTGLDATGAGKVFHMHSYYLSRDGGLFMAGSLLYFYREQIRAHKPWAFLISIGITITCLKGGDTAYMLSWLLLPYIVIYFALKPLPVFKDFGRYGDFSYGVYLYAFPIQQSILAIFGYPTNIALFFFGSMLGALICAYFSWHYIEAPALKLKGRFVNRSQTTS